MCTNFCGFNFHGDACPQKLHIVPNEDFCIYGSVSCVCVCPKCLDVSIDDKNENDCQSGIFCNGWMDPLSLCLANY